VSQEPQRDAWSLRPELEARLAGLQAAGREHEAAVVRRCIDLVKAGTPHRALREWSANRAWIEAGLGHEKPD
jgi:hypothetical protein